MKAIWNGTIIANAPQPVMLDGKPYFPPASIQRRFLKTGSKRTHCAWKGDATYFDLEVNGRRLPDSVWSYLEPLPAATNIRGYFAFDNRVIIE